MIESETEREMDGKDIGRRRNIHRERKGGEIQTDREREKREVDKWRKRGGQIYIFMTEKTLFYIVI